MKKFIFTSIIDKESDGYYQAFEGYIFVCGKNNINNGNNPYIGLIVME